MFDPAKAVDAFNARFGAHPGRRALHAKGTLCEATFTATAMAAELTRAGHMQGDPHPALVRLSNGAGDPDLPDYGPDVRGIAISFELPDGSRTDILAQTAPRFPVNTPESFAELVKASDPRPQGLARLALFLARNPRAITGLRHNYPALKPPPSYAACTFYAIHAFGFIDGGDATRFVRYTILPEEKIEPISGGEAKRRGRDYLQEDLRERLAAGPIRFTIRLQVAAPGDDIDDPRSVWPASREQVEAGVLEITGVHPDQSLADRMIFDPMRLTDGIEPSADPILNYRPHAYSESFARRSS